MGRRARIAHECGIRGCRKCIKMSAVQSQTIDRSALGAATRETHEDPGAMGFMCLDLGCGKQTLFFQEEVARHPLAQDCR